MYIVVRYKFKFKSLKPAVQYYSNNGTSESHYWSFSDRNVKLYNTLDEAQNAQSWAHDEESETMETCIEWSEELRQSENVEIGTFDALFMRAKELGLQVIY
jgi:hypothetical protein